MIKGVLKIWSKELERWVEIPTIKGESADMSNYYTKEDVDNLTFDVDMSNYYTKEEVDNLTFDVDMSNYYTKNEIDEMTFDVDMDNIYTKGEVDTFVEDLETKIENATIEIEGVIGDGLVNKDNKISLDSRYITYLDNILYQKPTISSFVTPLFLSGTQENGVTITGNSTITHTITNVDNMRANGKMSISGTQITTTETDYNTNVTLNLSITAITSGSYSIKISGTDVKGNEISSSKSFSTLYPHFIGIGGSTLTGNDIYNTLTKSMTTLPTSIPETKFTPTSEKRYVWICVADNRNVNYVTANGFEATFNTPVTIEVTNRYDVKHTYKCYRTSDMLNIGGEYSIKIIS